MKDEDLDLHWAALRTLRAMYRGRADEAYTLARALAHLVRGRSGNQA